jgi:DNA-binding transcriptional ArsR family regulator
MATTVFEPDRDDLKLADVLAALADPVRLRMVAEMHRTGETRCGDVMTDIPKSTRSHHLKVLREAGVTRTRIEGTERYSRLRYACLEARFPGLLASVLESAPALDSAKST